MQAVEDAVAARNLCRQPRLWDVTRKGHQTLQETPRHNPALIEEARALLVRAVRGNARVAADLRVVKDALIRKATERDAYACEILAAMCASGLGAARNAEDAREWIVRAVELLDDHVQRPVPGDHGFILFPADEHDAAYRPLYTAEGVLITDQIGTGRMQGGSVCFDRWGRPVLEEGLDRFDGPTRATPKSVAAHIARESTLEDFAWACRRTTRQFRLALIDARVIAHGRRGFQRCRSRVTSRFAAAA